MVNRDPNLLISIGVGAAVMLRWTWAYFTFPRALMRVMKNVDLGPFHPHLARVALFVRLCGHSHWIMAVRDTMMLGIMSLTLAGLYDAAIFTFYITLIPLIVGAEVSAHASRLLSRDADAINAFIRSAQKLADANRLD